MLYNSLGFARKELIKVIVSSSSVVVKDSAGSDVPSQVNPIFLKDKLVTGEYEVIAFVYFFLITFCCPERRGCIQFCN